MKLTKQIEVPAQAATTKTVEDGHACDVCKKVFRSRRVDHSVGWDPSRTTRYTAVATGTRFSYPECGGHKVREWHICPACFEEHLIPVLIAKAGEGTVEECQW